ncbi:MAG: o-succinylbenzoate synthase [Anaerolineae bacterium]|nr:o-succinylbenzoate synthase [Anaerolineae bacterium]MDQ7034514.1 o-succinylbenzoate synthase [Anaerolineae bacterium]
MKSISIKDIKLYPIALPLVEPLRTSFGMEPYKGAIAIEVVTENGISGWGECSAAPDPGYTGETMGTAHHILHNYMLGLVKGKTITDPREIREILRVIRYHEHAKHGLEAAVWDAFAKANDLRLTDLLASYLPDGHESRGKATVGVSIGLQPTMDDLFAIIDKRVGQGYNRIKLKIKPGQDIDIAKATRNRYPDTMIMLDANSAYTLADADHLAQLDDYDLLMIEQPLSHDDIYEHSKFAKRMKTPICLDESIKNVNDLRLAIEVGAIGILNLKPARVGGFAECLDIYNVCVEHDLPLWVGGMLEVGVGRAANISLASLPAVTMPSDISATDRYFDPDLTEPPFVLGEESTLAVADGIGIGVEVQRDRLEEAVATWEKEKSYQLG